jgi:RND superfamily putative drug exporter
VLDALARLASSRPRRVLALALIMALLAGAAGGGVASRLHPYGADDPATDSVKAKKRLTATTGLEPAVGLVALVDTPAGPGAPASRARVARVARLISRDPDVGRVRTFYGTHDRSLVSRSGRSQIAAVNFKPSSDKEQQDAAKRIATRLAGVPGVRLGGTAPSAQQVNHIVEHDLRRAELLAFPLLFLLSLVFFRSAVAAALPLFVGGLAIVGTLALLRLANELTEISVFALNLTTGLGLGLAIDYSLFVVSRYREEIARTGPGLDALKRTLATAGRTVLFSSLTVAAAMASLIVFPQRFLYSMGVGGTLVALLAATVALVVLPAVLALLGNRVNGLAPAWLQRAAERDARPAASGAWYRLSRFVMRRPVQIAVTAAVVLVLAGIPVLRIHFTQIDARVLPTSSAARQVDDTLRRDFPGEQSSATFLALDTPPDRAARAFAARLRRLPGAALVTQPQPAGRHTSVIKVVSKYQESAGGSQRLVRDIRAENPPFQVLAGGRSADFVDFKSSLRRQLPIALAIVALATFAILFLMTGSVVLPVKALVMNVLTLSATFGLLVLVFQDGRLEGLLDYKGQGALEVTMPVLLFALAFGLSTDYGVFLLSRIKEARDRGAANDQAVAMGLERTGRIVTCAALLFSVAIGAFATSQIVFIKENGIGTALAVLIDASIVRALLVPSLMELLGRWNWWAPSPLRRLHDRIGLSETSPAGA